MIDYQLVVRWLGAFRPQDRVSPSEFAEREIVLPPSANAVPGPLRLAAYQRELVDSIADDDVDTVVMMVSAQTGKSLSVLAMLGYIAVCDPGPAMHFSPIEKDSISFVRERLNPLIDSSPSLRRAIGKGQSRRKGSTGGLDSTEVKTFPGGQLSFGSSHKKTDVAARAIRYLLLDEVDKFVANVGGEGDPLELAIKRTATFEGRRRKIVIVSTPTTSTGSHVYAWYLRGDQRKFKLKCPDAQCGEFFAPEFGHIDWTKGSPETARLVCPHCGVVHDEAARQKMIDGGRWEATAKGEPGIRSYHMNALASRFATLRRIIQEYESAKTPEKKQAFYNTTLAQVYDCTTEFELSHDLLAERAQPIKPPYAADIVFVTAGVDVQGDRVEVTFLAQHGDGTASVLNHLKLPGDTTASKVWRDLDEALGTAFPLADGRTIGVYITAIDSGEFVDAVLRLVQAQRRKARRIVPIKGRYGFDRLPIVKGGKLRGQTHNYIVGVDGMKMELQKRLASEPGDEGYIRLPDHLPDEYFKGLASEELRQKAGKGAPQLYYYRAVRQNEPFDCLVYAAAIAKGINVAKIINPPAPEKKFDPDAFGKRVVADSA